MVFVLLAMVIVYSSFVLRRIRRSLHFTQKQKWLQALIVLAVPVFGAWFVHAMYRSDDELPLKVDRDHIPLDTGHS